MDMDFDDSDDHIMIEAAIEAENKTDQHLSVDGSQMITFEVCSPVTPLQLPGVVEADASDMNNFVTSVVGQCSPVNPPGEATIPVTVDQTIASVVDNLVASVVELCSPVATSEMVTIPQSDQVALDNTIASKHNYVKTNAENNTDPSISNELEAFSSSDEDMLVKFKTEDEEFNSSNDEPLLNLKIRHCHENIPGYDSSNDPEYVPATDKANSTDSEYYTSPDELLSELVRRKRKNKVSRARNATLSTKKRARTQTVTNEQGDEPSPVNNHASQLNNLLIANNLKLFHVEENGDSFFSSISTQISRFTPQQLRCMTSNEVENNLERYSSYLQPVFCDLDENDLYLELLNILEIIKQPESWSSCVEEIVPLAMAESLKTTIIIYSGERTRSVVTIDPITKLDGLPPVIICQWKINESQNRYGACLRIINEQHKVYSNKMLEKTPETSDNQMTLCSNAYASESVHIPQRSTNQSSNNGTLNTIPDIGAVALSHGVPQLSYPQGRHISGKDVLNDTTPQKKSPLKDMTHEDTPRKRAAFLTPPKKVRFRKMNPKPETWKRNVRKRLRLSCKEYVNSKGKNVEAKHLKAVNCDKCKFKCLQNVTEGDREAIFETFYKLANYEQQKQFVCANVTEKSTRTYLDSEMKPVPKSRKVSRRFSFMAKGVRVNVCKTFFMNTICVGQAYIDHALTKSTHGGIFTGTENRGRHQPPNKTKPEQLDMVCQHIKSFPALEGHYTRSTTKRKYLQEGLNITKMYELYQDFCKGNNYRHVSKGVYRKVFNEHFNYSFHVPKKDQCLVCTKYNREKSLNKDVSPAMEEEFSRHQEQKIKAREQKAHDKKVALNDKSVKAACFDLEAVLHAPCGLVSQMYYKRKLSCYNLSVYSLANNHGHNYMWNETEGKRGDCEIATRLYLYMSSLPVHIRHLIFYSDNCTGQNRNKFVAAALLSFIRSATHLEKIEHKFLETGHTQMECDSMHSAIEFAKKKTAVYIPSQWDTIIRMARRKNPYQVVPLKYGDFIDYKAVCHQLLKNTKTTTDGAKVNWLNIKCFQLKKSAPESIFVKFDYCDTEFKEIKCIGKSRRSTQLPVMDTLPKRYSKMLAVSEAKKGDLLDLCTSGVIPEDFHPFYHKLIGESDVLDNLPVPDIEEDDVDTDDE